MAVVVVVVVVHRRQKTQNTGEHTSSQSPSWESIKGWRGSSSKIRWVNHNKSKGPARSRLKPSFATGSHLADLEGHHGALSASSLLLTAALLLLGSRLPHTPEAHGLVSSSRADRSAVGGDGSVKDTGGVASEVSNLDEGRELPDGELVLREAVGREELLLSGGPDKRADLGVGVDLVDEGAGLGVVEANVAVSSARASGKSVLLPRAPGKSLDGGSGLVEGEASRSGGGDVPDVAEVVVGTGGELSAVVGPLEAADLLGVTLESGEVVLGNANIVVEDVGVAGARREDVVVPSKGRDTGLVTGHGADLLLALNRPELHKVVGGADSNVRAVSHPGHGGHDGVGVSGGVELEELVDGAVGGVPEVDGGAESNGDLVLGGPVKEVEVVVIDEAGGIEDALGLSSNVTEGTLGSSSARGSVLGVDAVEGVLKNGGLGGLVLESENLGVEGIAVEERLGELGREVIRHGGRDSGRGGGSRDGATGGGASGLIELCNVEVDGLTGRDETVTDGRSAGKGSAGADTGSRSRGRRSSLGGSRSEGLADNGLLDLSDLVNVGVLNVGVHVYSLQE